MEALVDGTFAHSEFEDYQLPDHETTQETSTTQLSEQFPQIDTPLRVDPPPNLKSPDRVETLSRDQQIRDSTFSPKAYQAMMGQSQQVQQTKQELSQPMNPKEGGRLVKVESSLKSFSNNQGPSKTAVSDYSLLAFSSQRSGKIQMEGQAYLAMSITLDNMQQHAKAIDSYLKFLSVCKKIGDITVEALAYNCLGVDYMLLACPPSEPSRFEGDTELTESARELLQKAVHYHKSHLEIADEGGQFVANSNLGLCFGLLGDFPEATNHHQEALRVAIRLKSFSGQGIAVGNLGLLAMRQEDYPTARACIEQYVHLVHSLKDIAAETTAWMLLGELGNLQGDYKTAVESYENAAQIAELHGHIGLLKRINCNIGVARGNMALGDHFSFLNHFASIGYAGAAEEDAQRRQNN
jgi:tetratricopeptide (TPR) repeat protein